MKTKYLTLAAVICAAVFVAGESVVVLDHAGRVAGELSAHVVAHIAKTDAVQLATHVVGALVCMAKT